MVNEAQVCVSFKKMRNQYQKSKTSSLAANCHSAAIELRQCDFISTIVLVTYGAHPKKDEPYAWKVGVLYRRRNPRPDKVTVTEYKGMRGGTLGGLRLLYGYEVMRRTAGAKYSIHLHDDTRVNKEGAPSKSYRKTGERLGIFVPSACYGQDESKWVESFDFYHDLLDPFRRLWNNSNTIKAHGISVEICDRPHATRWGHNIEVEFYNRDKRLKLDDGIRFLDSLVTFLLTKV